jgi:hypothetical protein
MTIDINFASAESGKTHEFNCVVPKSFKEKFESLYEEHKGTSDVMVIDERLKELNANSGNLISEYEYEIVSDTDINIGAVFKHLFRTLKEPMRYAKCKVRLADGRVMVKVTDKIQSPLKIPANCQRIPVSSIIADCADCADSDGAKLSIRFETTSPKSEMPNFDTVITFITEGLYEAFEEASAM